ncbi:MAG: hypothetical protein H7066_15610 [Cytophagaceae bacterium]|nr:hypothetical protein [Gemmatimonadaceae bacterium]
MKTDRGIGVGRRRAIGSRSPAVFALVTIALASAAPLFAQQSQIHDTASADSIRFDQAPLPGGAAAIFRFLFSGVPQWIQIGGVILGAIVAIALAVFAWRHRVAIQTWLTTRSRGTQMALGATVVMTLAIVGATGAWSWNYMQHENDFCSSCHVMKSAFGRFAKSEHDKLECHACHQQSIFASSKELYYWVMDRPDKIPAHAPVPNLICNECHEQANADSTWKRVSTTAGHQVHFRSDSLKDRGVLCIDCHAREVHAFKAVDVGCTQSGCHDKIEVRLGAMANQTGLHCVTCHEFGRSVEEHAAMDSSRQALVPARQQCFSCHEMREKLAKHDLDKDPHKANCGACHNPHEQTVAANAIKSCVTSGCHANADTLTAFHRGLGTHRLDKCQSCHKPHSWKVESTQCIDCHRDIYQDRVRPRARPATRGSVGAMNSLPDESPRRARGGPSADADDPGFTSGHANPVPSPLASQAARADTIPFQHGRHRKVACIACHDASRQHAAITVNSRAECQACHHAADARAGECSVCHAPAELPPSYAVPTTLRISRRAEPLRRDLDFSHARHERTACTTCHVPGSPQSQRTTCADCHTDHHRADATCSTCHADARASHTREAHLGCATCHVTPAMAALPESRTLCLTCHAAQALHKPGQECAACHRTGWGTRTGAT